MFQTTLTPSYGTMIIYITVLVTTCISITVSSEFSLKGDRCSKFDSCYSKSSSRTCSCDSSCQQHGNCCFDVQKSVVVNSTFQCYHRLTAIPVFAKRSCSDEFRGHIGHLDGCFDDDIDEMDMKNNLLVTSHKTKTTYWNKFCATCSNEASEDLEFWNIEVFCPPHKDVSRHLIRRNLTFDQDKRQWGLQIDDDFIECIVRYAPPSYIDEVNHCTPNLIKSCPTSYPNEAISVKCSQYYAERKLKNSEIYFKNTHCAICNGVDIKELECPGLPTAEDNGEETDFRDMVEEVFTSKDWFHGKIFTCSRGYVYDPLREMCRRYEAKSAPIAMLNSSNTCRRGYIAILAILFAFLY